MLQQLAGGLQAQIEPNAPAITPDPQPPAPPPAVANPPNPPVVANAPAGPEPTPVDPYQAIHTIPRITQYRPPAAMAAAMVPPGLAALPGTTNSLNGTRTVVVRSTHQGRMESAARTLPPRNPLQPVRRNNRQGRGPNHQPPSLPSATHQVVAVEEHFGVDVYLHPSLVSS